MHLKVTASYFSSKFLFAWKLEAHSEPCQTFKMECFAKIFFDFYQSGSKELTFARKGLYVFLQPHFQDPLTQKAGGSLLSFASNIKRSKWINQLVFPLRYLANLWFYINFRRDKNYLFYLNSLNIRRKIWQRSFFLLEFWN